MRCKRLLDRGGGRRKALILLSWLLPLVHSLGQKARELTKRESFLFHMTRTQDL